MRKTLLFLLFYASFVVQSQSGMKLFDESKVHEIRVTFKETKFWDTLSQRYLDALYDSTGITPNIPLMAKKVVIDGKTLDSVAVSQKGFYSNWGSESSLKKPLKIDFNEFVSTQNYDGLNSISLNSGFADPTMMHDVLAYKILRDFGVAAPRTSYAKVYLNDMYWGLYIIAESINKTFLKEHFPNSKGNLYKAEFADLSYKGDIDSAYYNDFELKTNNNKNDWSDLVRFSKMLNKTDSQKFKDSLEKNFNIEGFFKCLAVDIALDNWDSYFGHNRNFFLYNNPADNKMNWIPWDYNLAFDDSWNFSLVQKGDTIQVDSMTGQFVTTINRPLVSRTMDNPILQKQYLNIACQLKEKVILNSLLDPFIDKTATLIRPALMADTNKFYSISVFDSSIVIGASVTTYTRIHDSFPDGLGGFIVIDTVFENIELFTGLKPYIKNIGTKFQNKLQQLNVSCGASSTNYVSNESQKVNIFPIPVSDNLTIESVIPIKRLFLINSLGQVLKIIQNIESYKITINLGEYPSGLYFIKINDNDLQKVLIQR